MTPQVHARWYGSNELPLAGLGNVPYTGRVQGG
jgi:hypothetical protein